MKQRIAYLQWLRFFAAAAVVLMHTAANKWMSISFDTDQWRILTYYDSLVRWPVPIFIMITGALFLPRQTAMRDVFRRYIPRVLAAYLFWCGVYTLAAGLTGTPTDQLPEKFLEGHYHLWYLPFLCGVYLTIPFVQKIASDRCLTLQLLVISFVIGIGIPWLTDLAVLLAPAYSAALRRIEGYLNFTFFLDHLCLLVLGHWLHQTELTPRARGWIYAAGGLGVLLTAPLTLWSSSITGIQNSLFFDFTAPNNLCAAAALFVFAKYHLHTLPKIVASLASASFGIYLLHPLVIESLARSGVHVLSFSPWLAVPVISCLILGVCWLVSALLRRMPVIGKYLV